MERKETSANLKLNNIGKHIFWLQQLGDFHISLTYVPSADNRADIFTRQSSALEAALNQDKFFELWNQRGPFQWDLMASAANVRRNPQGDRLNYFSRYFDCFTSGVDLFAQKLDHLSEVYCFPPIPIIGMVIKCLMKYKINCIMVLPAVNDTWVNWVSVYIKDVYVLSAPYDKTVFTVLTNQGKYISKKYPFPMLAVKLDFLHPCAVLHALKN